MDGMKVVMGAVRAGRKVKSKAARSFKGVGVCVVVDLPVKAFYLSFSSEMEEIAKIVKFLLRCDSVHFVEEGFNDPISSVDGYEWWAGDAEDTETGITAKLWTRDMLWT
jgi:hypothetical protein